MPAIDLDFHFLSHALVVLLIGLLSGAPMGAAIVAGRSEQKINGWRVAHSGLTMGGVMLIVVAILVSLMQLNGWLYVLVVSSSIASGYGFAIALPIGAMSENRGLSKSGPRLNRLVHAGNIVGAYGSLIAVVALLISVAVRMLG